MKRQKIMCYFLPNITDVLFLCQLKEDLILICCISIYTVIIQYTSLHAFNQYRK